MSVRRLAEGSVQPAAFSFNRANAAWAKKKLKDYPKGREASGVIPLLMRAQEQDGWVTKAAIEHVAEMLDMPMIRVLEVATFYTQFQLAPVGKRAHIQVCGTTPCMLRGSEELMKVCKSKIAEKPFELNAEGTLSWEEVECQGACVNAPMVMIFKDTYEDLTPERLEEIIDAFEAGEGSSVPVGPQVDRIFSAPIGGLTTLTDVGGKPAKASAARAGGKAKTASAPKAKANTGKANTAKAKSDKANASKATAAKTKASKVKSPTAAKAVPSDSKLGLTSAVGGKTAVGQTSKTAVRKSAKSAAESAVPSAKKSATKPAAKKPVAAKAAAKSADAGKPAGIKKPKQPDDLKLISGIGPKIEGILHGLGVYKFEQIAKWTKAERTWVDGYLRFKGRIDRDEWTKQAKALAKGGRDEYVRVFGKEPR